MKRKTFKGIIAALAITMTAGLFVGCGKSEDKTNIKNNTEISGTITAVGSSALQPLVQQASKNFTAKNPKAIINVQGGGSGAGCNQVAAGNVEIGNSDVDAELKLKDKSLAKHLVDHKVCAIGFAVVVHKDVKVDSLTKDQVQDIFTGKITNWKEVGGEDKKINVINRSKSSGTRTAFKQTIMDKKDEKEGLGTTQDSSGNVRVAMKQTEGSISYLALSYITEDVKKDIKMLKINDVEATKENIISNEYPFWSYEHMYTKGEAKGLTKAFLDYMISEDNKATIDKLGYIPISDMKK
ncbi:phosphate ABC transporter substrate-binding protein [Haloimpatiens sp. FM7330]|uniref:phosphate ABC transporter substrate-binding protein n=1 Tax=Haloimpatiens sp. FM7330 TaxID=3298610 RepID=UPI00363E9EB0